MGVARFQIAFDGNAVRDGSIDVRALAPSLLALGDLFEESNRVLNGDQASAQLRVRGDFRKGSFEGSLELVVSLYEIARSIFLHDKVQDAKQILETVGFFGGAAGGGLWWLVKRVRGRMVKRARVIETDSVVLELEDGDEIEARRDVANLYNDAGVLRASREVLRPLDMEGVDTLSIGDDAQEEPQIIEKSDVAAFEAPVAEQADEETLGTATSRRILRVVRPSFQEDFVWTFSDGTNTLTARMEDPGFIGEVEDGLGFSRDSVVEADIQSVATRTPTGRLSTRNTVTKVHRVISPPKQVRFDFESGQE